MAIFFKYDDGLPPPYLDRIDELEYMDIVRLKGNIDQEMIPVMEERIEANRKAGSRINKNILVDYAKVDKIDTAAIAFHLLRLQEYQEHGFSIGFINLTDDLKAHLDMFKGNAAFKVYDSEAEAVEDLNRVQNQ